MNFLHFPTYILMFGYALFWFRLFVFNDSSGVLGIGGYLCVFVGLCLFLIVKFKQVLIFLKKQIKDYYALSKGNKFLAFSLFSCLLIVFVIVIYALTFPVHLIQEYDCLNYHMTLPRQHLIAGNFMRLLPFSADLFVLPLQFALAPFWLAFEVPNKFIHIFFVVALFALVMKFYLFISKGDKRGLFFVLASLLALHCLGIQMSTAMLDIVVVYLFFAAVDSFVNKNYLLSSCEFSFLIFAKSFNVILFSALGLLYLLFIIFRKSFNFVDYKKFSQYFLVFVVLIGGPFLVKSFIYSGTPLFPFAVGIIEPLENTNFEPDAIANSAQRYLRAKDAYGYGRNLKDFLLLPWRLSVPDAGVNNKFDYPAGLPVLLFFPLFIFFFVRRLFLNKLTSAYLITFAYYILWFFGSQQTRFLYIPIFLMCVLVIYDLGSCKNRVLLFCLLLAVAFNCVSILRSNLPDFKNGRNTSIRTYDNELLVLNRINKGRDKKVEVFNKDVAYACFPVYILDASKVQDRDLWLLKQSYGMKIS